MPAASLKWSAAFSVAPEAFKRKDLRGDKIILPQSALEQLLAASASTATTPSTFTSYDPSNPYLGPTNSPRHSFLADIHQPLPNPLMFRLVNKANGNVVHAGIREFSAAEGRIELSPYLLEALGLETPPIPDASQGNIAEEGAEAADEPALPEITVHAKQLPKGVYVRLRPCEAGYDPDDWKPLLERQLRESFTTLSNGAILSVRGVKGEMFRFLIDKFEPEEDGICVVDTDLEVDIEALDEEQARETMRQIMEKAKRAPGTPDGSSIGHEINIWKAVEGQVLPGDYVDYELPSWSRSRPLEIELSGLNDEYGVDLFVSPQSARQRASPRETEHVFGVYTATSNGSKKLTIQPSNVELEGAEAMFISVHGYLAPGAKSNAAVIPFKLRVKSVVEGSAPSTPMDADASQETSADEEECKNCHQMVPRHTMALHENYCRRNNIACPQCDNVFQKNSEEWAQHWHCPHDAAYGSSDLTKVKHDDIYHTERQCPMCPFETNSMADLARHRTTLCPGKIILCRFCHLEVPQEGDPFNPSAETIVSGLTEHEVADGARTTDCHLCSKIVRLRDMETHLKHHEFDKAHRPKPPICRNANCGRTLHGVGRNGQTGAGTHMGQGPGNDLGLCSLCFAPLYVQMHDATGNALRRRIERRYLTQMMMGCKKKSCANRWCRTGRANLGLDAKPTSSTALLPLVKPLTESVRQLDEPMFFCVDEASQRRRKVAEILMDETSNAWDLEWCVAACEAEGGNLAKAHEWLGNWAPTRG